MSSAGCRPTGAGAASSTCGAAGALAGVGQRAQPGDRGGEQAGARAEVGLLGRVGEPGAGVDDGGGQAAGAGHADHLGGHRLGPAAQHHQHRLVADALRPAGWTAAGPGGWRSAAYQPTRGARRCARRRPRRRRPRRTGRRCAAATFGAARAGEGAHQRADAAHVGVPAALAGEDQAVALGVLAGARPRSTGRGARGTWPAASSASGVSGSGGGGGGVGSARAGGAAALEDALGVQARADAGRVGDQRPGDQHGGDRGGHADSGVRAAPGRAGPHHDRGARPAHRLQPGRQRLEDGADGGRRHLAVHGELRAGGLELALGGRPG